MTNLDLLRQIDEARDRLCVLMREQPAGNLARKPAPAAWSVIENVRHLIYAEQLHLGRTLLEEMTWSPLGLPTDGKPRRNGCGTASSDDLEEVLTAWDAVHAPIREAASTAIDADAALDRNLRHLRGHIRTINALLKDATH